MFRLITRQFATAANLKKKLPVAAGKTGASTTTAPPPVNISKMPPPQPVLTPLIKKRVLDAEVTAHTIEISSELQKRLPRSLLNVSEMLGGNYYIQRGELMDLLKKFVEESGSRSILIDGPSGSGKSVILLQLFVALREDPDVNNLIFYAPNAAKWTTGHFPYYPTTTSTSTSTSTEPKQYLQPELALEMLNLLYKCNETKLKNSTLLADIGEAAQDPFNRAIPLFDKIFGDKSKRFTFLIDSANGLLDDAASTGYLDASEQPLRLAAFPLLSSNFRKIPGKFIAATTHSDPALPKPNKLALEQTLSVKNYSKEEIKSVLDLYSALGHSHPKAANDEQFIGLKAFVSGGNGRKLFKSCEYDAIYYNKH